MLAISIVFFLLAVGAFVISICSFLQKGFLFNNAYLYASKQDRAAMDKKPYYRQSAVAFLLVGFCLLSNAAAILFSSGALSVISMIIAACAIVYAISSAIAIERSKKQQG